LNQYFFKFSLEQNSFFEAHYLQNLCSLRRPGNDYGLECGHEGLNSGLCEAIIKTEGQEKRKAGRGVIPWKI
jgi:hypothetical protein